MVVRVRRAKSGLSQYLRDGKKADSIYNREDKDVVTSLGSLDDFERAENYCVENKNWSENYMHITFGFSDNDYQKIESLPSKEEQNALMQELVQDYIKHHFSGYDIDNEIISYAELHYPKIKYDEHDNKRYPHIHLGISFLNPLSHTKLRNLFANTSFYDEVMVRKSNLKFGFQQTKRKEFRIKNFDSQLGRDRREWIEILDDLNDREELIYFLENQMNFKEGIDYRVVDTKKNNNYIKLIGKSYKTDKSGKKIIIDINIQGGGFERFVDVNSDAKNYKKLEDMTQEELEEILNDVYAKRVEEIGKRRSKKATEDLKKIYEDDEKLKKNFEKKYSKKSEYNSFKSTFQQKIFYKHYGVNIQDSLRGYYIKINEPDVDNTTFINRLKGIKVQDKGDEIVSYSNADSIQEEARLMIDISLAKGWNLLEMKVDGSPEFIKEAKRQILLKVEEQKQTQEKKELKKVEIKPTRPVSQLDNFILENESKIFEVEKVNNLKFLKENLPAQVVLDFAKQKYNINLDEFEVADGNKIKNKIKTRQQPKSIIDFFTKDIGISLKEATEICNDLMAKQPKKEEEITQKTENDYKSKHLDELIVVNNKKQKRRNRT